MSRGDATTSWTRGLRKVEREATIQQEERPSNRVERGQSGRKTKQPTMAGRGNGGWWPQSCRLMGDNTTTSHAGHVRISTHGYL